jgi:hypothetical protein
MMHPHKPSVMIHCSREPRALQPATWIDDELTGWLEQIAPMSNERPEGIAIDGRIVVAGCTSIQQLAKRDYGVTVHTNIAIEIFGLVSVLNIIHAVSCFESVPRCIESFIRCNVQLKATDAN